MKVLRFACRSTGERSHEIHKEEHVKPTLRQFAISVSTTLTEEGQQGCALIKVLLGQQLKQVRARGARGQRFSLRGWSVQSGPTANARGYMS